MLMLVFVIVSAAVAVVAAALAVAARTSERAAWAFVHRQLAEDSPWPWLPPLWDWPEAPEVAHHGA